MIRAIRAVGSGETIFSPAVAERVLAFLTAPRPSGPGETFPTLTGREREILDLIALGHNNLEIAKRLFLSPKTVNNYVSSIFTKLRVSGHAEAIVRAREAGLGGEEH